MKEKKRREIKRYQIAITTVVVRTLVLELLNTTFLKCSHLGRVAVGALRWNRPVWWWYIVVGRGLHIHDEH